MITLLSTDKLIAYMAEAKDTTEPTFDTAYYDNKSAETDVTESTTFGSLNSTTDVDLVAAPAATYNRNVTHITICNVDVIAHTITIAKDVSGTDTILFKIYLKPNETWCYPVPETRELQIVNAKTNIGRTITTQTDDLEVGDVGTRVLSNYTGTGIQTLTIPEGIYNIGDTIKIIRIAQNFKIEVENSATQEINTDCYSNKIGDEVEVIYARDNGGKESWFVINGIKLPLLETEETGLLAVSETTDYYVYLYGSYNNLFITGSQLTYLKIVNKITNEVRILNVALSSSAPYSNAFFSLYYNSHTDSVYLYNIFYVNITANKINYRISNTNLIKNDLILSNLQDLAQNAPYKVIPYTKSGVKYILGGNISATVIREYSFIGDILTATAKGVTVTTNYGMISGCWNGVDGNGASTSMVYMCVKTGGVYSVDMHDYSIVATLATVKNAWFLHDQDIDGFAWYVKSGCIGKIQRSDNSITEYVVGVNMNFPDYTLFAAMDEDNEIIYGADKNGTSYIIALMSDPAAYQTIDLSATLGAFRIKGLTYLKSTNQLVLFCQAIVEISATETKTFIIQL